jgi:hypothetical protein
MEGSADRPEAWVVHVEPRGSSAYEQPSPTSLSRQCTSADRNLGVQAKHYIQIQQACTTDADARSDMPCRRGVLAVLLEVGNWHASVHCPGHSARQGPAV